MVWFSTASLYHAALKTGRIRIPWIDSIDWPISHTTLADAMIRHPIEWFVWKKICTEISCHTTLHHFMPSCSHSLITYIPPFPLPPPPPSYFSLRLPLPLPPPLSLKSNECASAKCTGNKWRLLALIFISFYRFISGAALGSKKRLFLHPTNGFA